MMDDLDPEKNTQEISVSWPACFYMEREGAYGFRVVAASATHDRRPPIAVQCKSQPLLHYLVIYWPVTHDTTLILGLQHWNIQPASQKAYILTIEPNYFTLQEKLQVNKKFRLIILVHISISLIIFYSIYLTPRICVC